MKTSVHSGGFTIVETLIVLAMTGFLLTMAIVMINGRQNATQFSQSVRDTESRIQKVINEVSNGYYPSSGSFSCNGDSGLPVLTTLSGSQQGTNKNCIFLGKVIQFSAESAGSSTLNVFSVVGVRKTTTGPITSLATAQPRLIAQGNIAADATVPNAFEVQTMPYSLTASEMYYTIAPSTTKYPVWAVGFISKLNTDSFSADDASQQFNVHAIPGVTQGASAKTAVDQINAELRPGGAVHTTTAATNPTGGVKLCLLSGDAKKSALLSIGGQGRQLSVSVAIKNNTNCT